MKIRTTRSEVCSKISSDTSGLELGRRPLRLFSNSMTRGSKIHYLGGQWGTVELGSLDLP